MEIQEDLGWEVHLPSPESVPPGDSEVLPNTSEAFGTPHVRTHVCFQPDHVICFQSGSNFTRFRAIVFSNEMPRTTYKANIQVVGDHKSSHPYNRIQSQDECPRGVLLEDLSCYILIVWL